MLAGAQFALFPIPGIAANGALFAPVSGDAALAAAMPAIKTTAWQLHEAGKSKVSPCQCNTCQSAADSSASGDARPASLGITGAQPISRTPG